MKKNVKLFALMAVLFLSVFTLSACGKSANQSSLQKIKSRGTLIVGMISSNPPYEFHTTENGKDKLRGSDLLLNALC